MLIDFEDKQPAPPIGWRGRFLIALGCLLGAQAMTQAAVNLFGYLATGLNWLI